MKPLMLSVQAFGPFAGEQILDFTQLGQNPLFLINGATGAGKSTLLDAMCFALYGQTSGSDRDATQMRCDHATYAILTQVTLRFCVKGKDYKVERIPQQERNKTRGEGTTTQTTEANLWQIDNNPVNQDNNQETIIIAKSAQKVTQYITELMGLTLEQFRQVMILPQGKFREFLLADSSAREKIFSTLFQTHIYQRLEEKLKDAAKNVTAQHKLLQHDTTQLLAEFECENTETLTLKWHAQQQTLTEVEQKRDLTKNTLEQHQKALELANILAEEFEQLALKQQQLIELNSQTTLFENKNIQLQQNEKAKTIKPDYTHFERIEQKHQQAKLRLTHEEQNLQQINLTFTAAQNQLAKAKEQNQALPKIQEQLRDLTALLPQIDQLHTTQQALNNHQKSVLAEQEHCNTLAANIHNNEQHLENSQQKIIELKDAIAQLPACQAEFDRQKSLGVHIKQRNELNAVITQQHSEINALNNTLKISQTDCDNKTQQLNEYEYLWHSQQAAILAQQLQPNTPCLVCGSTNHPNPANSTAAKLVDVATIDKQKQLLDNATQELHKHNITLAQLKAEFKSNSQRFDEITQSLAGDANINIDQLRESCQQLNDKIKALKAASETLPPLIQQEKTLKNQINNDRLALEKKQEAFNQVQTTLALAQAEYKRLEQITPKNLRDKKTVNQTITQYEKTIAQTEQQLQSAQKNFDDVNIDNVKQQQLIHELQAALKLQQAELNQAQTTWLAQLKSCDFKDTQDFNKAQLSIEQALTLTQEIEHYTKTKNELGAVIHAQTQKLKSQTPPNIQSLKTEVQASLQAHEAQLNLWQQQKSLVDHIKNTLKKLEHIHKQTAKAEEQHRLVGTLAQCASGSSGKRISLQRFVLGVLLDDVLIEASERLIKMSKGRYRLLRNLERTKGNSASGLDLLIEDNHTGKTRSAATLSGGESFLAALALALGLTDVVHAYAGGVQLDALFIDEGFGSLDQEALDLALQTLIDLQHSGKMIGIISHVSELKEQMALRVDITSSASGSEIKLKI